jgi:HD-like signal output (HDOD) protein
MLNPHDFKLSLWTIKGLEAMPAVLIKVWELAKDPNTDIDTIGNVLKNDGPLAAGVIRLSNSPYYASATFHSSLTSAIKHIGMRELVRMVNLSFAQQMFARDLPSYGISAADYWSDSVASALVMEALANHTGSNQEDAYTVGILHAIGRLLINRVIEEKGYTIYWDGQQPIQDWERSSVGFDFAEAGAMLLEHWRFPRTTCEPIRYQIDPHRLPAPLSMEGMLQFTARLLALTGSNFQNDAWRLAEPDPFVQAAEITPETFTALVSACRDEFQRVRESVDLG